MEPSSRVTISHFAFLRAMNESSCCSLSLSAFAVVSVSVFGHSNRSVVVSHCLIHDFLMTYNVEHLFICLFAICVPSLAMCLIQVFCHFSIGWFIFLLVVKDSLYIWGNSPLSDLSFANIFSHSGACLLFLFINLIFELEVFGRTLDVFYLKKTKISTTVFH